MGVMMTSKKAKNYERRQETNARQARDAKKGKDDK